MKTHDAVETPAFVIDEELLTGQVRSFKEALKQVWPNSVLSYSVKTNSLPWLVAWMGRNDVPAEVVSLEEWQLALACGQDPSKVVLNGPIKTKSLLDEAFEAGAMVNIDSRRELRWVLERAKQGLKLDNLGLRVNWDVNRDAPDQIASGEEGLRFGFHMDNGDLDAVVEELQAAKVPIAGLHLHVTSLTRSLDTYRSAAKAAVKLVQKHHLKLSFLDMGGGFFGGFSSKFPTPTEYIQTIRDLATPIIDPEQTTLILEPGSALVAVPFEFHSTVIDTKPVQDHLIVVTDASRTNLDTFFRKSSYEHEIISFGKPTSTPQIICGFTCLDYDRLMTLKDVPELSEGDQIIYYKVGSYTLTFNPLFIKGFPRVYVRSSSGELRVVRQPTTVQDFLIGNDIS